MPPKPLAEDLARKKAERDKQRKAEEALAVLEKPSGFEQAVAAIKDPVGTVKQLGREAKKTFYDPINRAQRALNPFEDLTPMQRATGIAEGALVAADALTPGLPEGAISQWGARRLAKKMAAEAPERTFEYGIHHSLTPGIKTIQPSRAVGQVTALDARPGSTYFWATEGPDASAALKESVGFQLPRAVGGRADWIAEPPEFYTASPRIYVTRAPKGGIVPDENVPGSIARRIEQPLRSVREIDPTIGYEQMNEQLRRAGLRAPGFTRETYEKAMQDLAKARQVLEQQRQVVLRDMGMG